MAKTTTLPMTQSFTNIGVALTNASSFTATQPGTSPTNTVPLFTAGAEGSVVKSLIMSTDATAAAQTVGIWISTDAGTTKMLIGVVNVPLSSGYTGAVVNVDALANLYLQGLDYGVSGRPELPMQANAVLYCGCLTTAVAANKTLWITGCAQNY